MASILKTALSLRVLLSNVLILSSATAAAELDFLRDIAPILEERCTYCHGEDEQESGLRLDQRAAMLRGGDSGLAAVVPGQPAQSYLIDVISHRDPDVKMPPEEDQLPAEEIELLARWIKAGALWPGQMQDVVREKSAHWSFQPILRPDVPEPSVRTSNPIDAFLLAKLAEHDLSC